MAMMEAAIAGGPEDVEQLATGIAGTMSVSSAGQNPLPDIEKPEAQVGSGAEGFFFFFSGFFFCLHVKQKKLL